MTLYSYRATTQLGEDEEGTLEADSVAAARRMLYDRHLKPVEIVEVPSEVEDSFVAELQPDTAGQAEAEAALQADEAPVPPAFMQESPDFDWSTADPNAMHSTVDTRTPLPATSPHAHDDDDEQEYYPLSDTLRLYAGWLLACNSIVYGLGAYQSTRSLPFAVPYVEGLMYSPLILTFTLAAFLFLLMTSLQRLTGNGIISRVAFSVLGVALFVLYRINV